MAAGALGTRRRRLRVVMGVAGCVLSGLAGVAASCRQNMLEGERHRADTAAIAAQAKLLERTDALNDANRTIAKRSAELARKSEEIARLTRDARDAAVGGDSYCYAAMVACGERCVIGVVHEGGHPLYDVTMRIVDVDAPPIQIRPDGTVPLDVAVGTSIPVGTIAPRHAVINPEVKTPEGRESIRWNVFFQARNGDFETVLRAKRANGEWKVSYRVLRGFETAPLKEHLDPAVPIE